MSGKHLDSRSCSSPCSQLCEASLRSCPGQHFESTTWLHRARQMPKAEFQREIEKAINGADSEPSELIYFKLYKSQIPVIEQAIEVAGLMLGSDKSRGYCLARDDLCRLSRRSTPGGRESRRVAALGLALLPASAWSTAGGLPVGGQPESLVKKIRAKAPRLRIDPNAYCELHRQVLQRDGWRCQFCGSLQQLQVHHLKFRSRSGDDDQQNLITLCAECHGGIHKGMDLRNMTGYM